MVLMVTVDDNGCRWMILSDENGELNDLGDDLRFWRNLTSAATNIEGKKKSFKFSNKCLFDISTINTNYYNLRRRQKQTKKNYYETKILVLFRFRATRRRFCTSF